MSGRPESSVGDRTIRGAALMTAQVMASKAVTAVGQLVLAAVLVPEAFGLIGMAYTIMGFASVVQRIGVREVLIREQDKLERWANAAFWLSAVLGLVVTAVMCATADLAAAFYDSPEVKQLVLILALAQPAQAIALTLEAQVERDMRYRAVAAVQFGTSTGQIVLTVALALLGFGAASFAWPRVVIAIGRLIALARLARPKLLTRPQLHRWPLFLNAGVPTLGSALLETVLHHSAIIILGMLTIASQVGFYFFAFNQSTVVAQMFIESLTRVLMPGLATMRDEPVRQVGAFLRGTELLATLVTPIAFMQAALAGPVLTLFFGDRWAPAIVLLQVLSVAAGISAVGRPSVSLLMAQGRYTARLALRLYGTVLFILFVGTGAFVGARSYQAPLGAAIGAAVFRFFYNPVGCWVACRPGGIGVGRIIPLFAIPLTGSVIGIGLPWLAAEWLFPGSDASEQLAKLAVTATGGVAGTYLWLRFARRATLQEIHRRASSLLPDRILSCVPAWLV